MKKVVFLSALIIGLSSLSFGQSGSGSEENPAPTSIGMVVYSQDVETIWNALRLANFAVNSGDTVEIFLLGKGVVVDSLAKTNADIKKQTDTFLNSGGTIQGCGTCLRSRNNVNPQVCTMSSMSDLYAVIRKNKILLTF